MLYQLRKCKLKFHKFADVCKKPILHESRSHEYNISFASEIYFGIHQFGNEFFLHHKWLVLKENKHTLSERMEKEKAISESTVNSQQIGITLKLEDKKNL